MNRASINILVASLATVCLAAMTAEAGSMTTYLTVAGRFDNAFNPLPLPLVTDIGVPNGYPGIYQIDVSFTATNSAGDKGWANTLFDAGITGKVYGSDLRLDLGLGWTPNSNTLDINNILPGGVKPIFATNLDAGTSGDLRGILASIESANIVSTANDTRNNLGTASAPLGAFNPPDPGIYIGSFYVNWDGVGPSYVVLRHQQYSFTRLDNTFGPTQQGDVKYISFSLENGPPSAAR